MKSDRDYLADRLEEFDRKVRGVINGDLSAQGQAIAIGLLVTMNMGIFAQAASAIRALEPKS